MPRTTRWLVPSGEPGDDPNHIPDDDGAPAGGPPGGGVWREASPVATPKAGRARWDDDDVDPEETTYLLAQPGPQPPPDWVITAAAARQHERGILKTGKEADVHLVERTFGGRTNLLAAKRYRDAEERTFKDDARYRDSSAIRESRLRRAVERGTTKGRRFRADLWLANEFEVLSRLWLAGAPVPYPVQRLGQELLLELIGDEDATAPRLVHAGLDRQGLDGAWHQIVEAMHLFARLGVIHADLSPYNILVWEGRLVVIDFPQAVDPIAHPDGVALLQRDVDNLAHWFGRRGVDADPGALLGSLVAELW